MADLIDREELRKLFKQRIFVWSNKDEKLLMGKDGKWVDALCELPAVDAEPVVHGRWIEEDDRPVPQLMYYANCNCCGERGIIADFCCWCGAKMDGGSDNV